MENIFVMFDPKCISMLLTLLGVYFYHSDHHARVNFIEEAG